MQTDQDLSLEGKVKRILSNFTEINESIFRKGISREYVADIYEFISPQLTRIEDSIVCSYIKQNQLLAEEPPEKTKTYKTHSTKSFVEDPNKKCPEFLHYFDCSCSIPSYIISFLEQLGTFLEEKAKEKLSSLCVLHGDIQHIPRRQMNDLFYRELPITPMNILPQKVVIKKRNDSKGSYEQHVPTHYGYILRPKDFEQFKKYIKEFTSTTPLNEHSSFSDQDFKYIPSCYKIMYNLPTTYFTEEDIDTITRRYVVFYHNFQKLKTQKQYQNIPKIFTTFLRIINNDDVLKKRYKTLDQFFISQNQQTVQKNNIIYEACGL